MAVYTAEATEPTKEDGRLFDLIEAKKSWVFISANLKRPAKTVRDRLMYLRRQDKIPVKRRSLNPVGPRSPSSRVERGR